MILHFNKSKVLDRHGSNIFTDHWQHLNLDYTDGLFQTQPIQQLLITIEEYICICYSYYMQQLFHKASYRRLREPPASAFSQLHNNLWVLIALVRGVAPFLSSDTARKYFLSGLTTNNLNSFLHTPTFPILHRLS